MRCVDGLDTKQIADAILAQLKPLLDQRIAPRLMTVRQAAQYLGRTEKGTYHLVASGALPSVRSDARLMLDRQDLDKWIEANKS